MTLVTVRSKESVNNVKTKILVLMTISHQVNKIIRDMSSQKAHYKDLFENEMNITKLLKPRITFRIRHHDYIYKRYLSLISISIQYLD